MSSRLGGRGPKRRITDLECLEEEEGTQEEGWWVGLGEDWWVRGIGRQGSQATGLSQLMISLGLEDLDRQGQGEEEMEVVEQQEEGGRSQEINTLELVDLLEDLREEGVRPDEPQNELQSGGRGCLEQL